MYYKMSVLPHSIRLSDNEPLDASGNVLQHETSMVSFGDSMPGAHALIANFKKLHFHKNLKQLRQNLIIKSHYYICIYY